MVVLEGICLGAAQSGPSLSRNGVHFCQQTVFCASQAVTQCREARLEKKKPAWQ